MRKHFMQRHPRAILSIVEEGPHPLHRCDRCDMFIHYQALNQGHQDRQYCREGTARKRHRTQQHAIRKASETTFTLLGDELEIIDFFSYLGRIFAADNNDWSALFKNLKKARQKWALLSRPLIKTGVKPRVIGFFYKAVAQSVLLYGCETWVVTPRMLKALDAFHHNVARRISNRQPRKLPNDTWVYPDLQEAMEIAGLHSIEHYI